MERTKDNNNFEIETEEDSDEISEELMLSISRAWDDLQNGRYTREKIAKKNTKNNE